MCGIVGYVGEQQALEVVVDGLRRLEYRGYDSAGVSVLDGDGLQIERRAGKLANLEKLLADRGADTPEVWSSILENEGSVQHLEGLTPEEKDVFKTAFELDQRWIIELAADRTPEICQSQSLNVFLPGDVDKFDLHMIHWTAWEKGCKSLYYLRSKSVQRAAFAGADPAAEKAAPKLQAKVDYDECLACQ